MIDIDSIEECYEGEDIPVVVEGTASHILVTAGNLIRKVAKAAFSLAGHLHLNEVIRPGGIQTERNDFYISSSNSGFAQMRHVDSQTSVTVMNGKVLQYAGGQMGIRVVDGLVAIAGNWVQYGFGLVLGNVSPIGKGLANGWDTYASSIRLKTNVKPVKDPVKKVKKASGITFEQDGRPGVGISAEDLESLELPGLATRGDDGSFVSINMTLLIPVLVEAIKELDLRVESLEQGGQQ